MGSLHTYFNGCIHPTDRYTVSEDTGKVVKTGNSGPTEGTNVTKWFNHIKYLHISAFYTKTNGRVGKIWIKGYHKKLNSNFQMKFFTRTPQLCQRKLKVTKNLRTLKYDATVFFSMIDKMGIIGVFPKEYG